MGACQAFFRAAKESCQNDLLARCAPALSRTGNVSLTPCQQHDPLNMEGFVVYVDGSWDQAGGAGIGVYLLQNGSLVRWISKGVRASTSDQAEALAVLEGLQILHLAIGEGRVLSDSTDIVSAIQAATPVITNWRAFSEIWQSWKLRVQSQGKYRVLHCNREDATLKIAHKLANQGRTYGWEKTGCTENDLNMEELV
ncbi:hypothetical protein FCM35_KLT15045 [Carex littledalei]|uniref:RNase H type-1 domain-containing protein n=1 Tax=Carex littledalei TaxID=544730 RepID=A0A833QE67_9POAL|nr:hypothetical protein FCM35_KLT15045 [Carex littledalei]